MINEREESREMTGYNATRKLHAMGFPEWLTIQTWKTDTPAEKQTYYYLHDTRIVKQDSVCRLTPEDCFQDAKQGIYPEPR